MQQLRAYEQQVVSKRPAARANSLKTPKEQKSRLPSEASQKPSLARGNSGKICVEDLEDGKSVRSQAKSVRTHRQDTAAINISVLAPTKSKRGQNPEESFLSKADKVPSVLNKSFATSKPPSEKKPTEQSFLESDSRELPELPDLALTKKTSSSRDDFTKRVGLLDLRNFEINNKIA